MPGKRLSHTESRLLDWWKNSDAFEFPTLRSLSIKGCPGLRGVEDLSISFDYPLSVICGKNGCGKTTVLAVSALGFRSPAGHLPKNALRHPRKNEDFSYYTFSDFFFKGPSDPDTTGIAITWRYRGRGEKELPIHKGSKKWMHYERRPERPVHYFGVARSVPAIEQRVLRTYFGEKRKDSVNRKLNDSFRDRLSEIMGRPYKEAEVMSSARYSVRRCTSYAPYSSFNMGAGEDILIELLYYLQETPNGSLIVIEEIELGLHPEALSHLAKHLQDIIQIKKLQVIVSTHSHYFIDNVPREARILIQRAGNLHVVTQSPTTMLAIGKMSGQAEPELNIYCEDNFSALLLEQSLPAHLLSRIKIVPVGSKQDLPKQATCHIRAEHKQALFLVWDGDVSDQEADRLISQEGENVKSKTKWIKLPGDVPPEKWVVNSLNCEEGYVRLAGELKTNKEDAAAIIERLCAFSNHHDIGHEFSQTTNYPKEEALRILARSCAKLSIQPFKTITENIESMLTGKPTETRTIDVEITLDGTTPAA